MDKINVLEMLWQDVRQKICHQTERAVDKIECFANSGSSSRVANNAWPNSMVQCLKGACQPKAV